MLEPVKALKRLIAYATVASPYAIILERTEGTLYLPFFLLLFALSGLFAFAFGFLFLCTALGFGFTGTVWTWTSALLAGGL